MNSTFYTVTPLHTSSKLKKELNLNIYYKMECSQPSGSFKIRGMETLCRHHFAEGKRDFKPNVSKYSINCLQFSIDHNLVCQLAF